MAQPTCADIMRVNLRTISEDEDVRLASSEMMHDEIRHLLVVDSKGKLVGVISDRDLLRAPDPNAKLRSLMSRDILAVSPETSAADAAERLIRGKYDALPIIDAEGQPVGIVTSTDFIDIAYRALVGLDPAVKRVRA